MNRCEFEAVLTTLGLDAPGIKSCIYRFDHFAHYWNDLKISFSIDKKMAQISGKIPLEFSKDFYEKYPGLRREVSISPTMQDINPESVATNSDLEKCIRITQEILKDDKEKIDAVISSKKSLLLKDNIDDFVTHNYYATSKEGLLITLAELQHYYIKKIIPNFDEMYSQSERLEKLFSNLTKTLITNFNPYFTTLDFVLENSFCKKLSESFFANNTDKTDVELKNEIIAFDQAVNPFSSNGNKMLEPSEYMDRLDLNFNFFGPSGDMYIRDKENNAIVRFDKKPLELRYSINFQDGENNIRITHEIGRTADYDINGYDRILLSTFPLDSSKIGETFKIEYDLLNGTFKENEQPTDKPNDYQKSRVIDYLRKGNEAAKALTIDNMTRSIGPTIVKGL